MTSIAEVVRVLIVLIGAVLIARALMVVFLPRRNPPIGIPLHSWRFVIFWSGLRGALSLALPIEVPNRNLLIFSTYVVILFTLLVQGFSLRLILHRLPSVSEITRDVVGARYIVLIVATVNVVLSAENFR